MLSGTARSLALAALIAGVLAVACTDGDDVDVVRRRTPEGPTPVLGGDAAALYDLLTRGFDATYTIEYAATDAEGSKLDSFVIYNSALLTRIDTVPPGDAEASSLVIGRDEDTETVSCTNRVGGWECFEIEALGDSLLALAGPNVLPTIWDLGPAEVQEAEPREIAGQVATCYRFAGRNEPDEAEYCLSEQGVPLYTATSAGVVEATSFSSEVEDGDFEPPARVQPS